MIQRLVCFKFIAGVTADQVKQHMDDFSQLKQEISSILEYRGGEIFSDPGKNPAEYDSLHYLLFQTKTDMEGYIPHPAHQKFIQKNKAIWEKVLVLNSEF